MTYEVEFKMIDIKDVSKIEKREKVKDNSFGEEQIVEHVQDIADQYCVSIIENVRKTINEECEIKFLGCTQRIGSYEFEITKNNIKYGVVFQKDTYEWNSQLTVLIGYVNRGTTENVRLAEINREYDIFLEKLKIYIKNVLIRDWYKCVWISDNQSLELSKEVYSEIYMAENELRAFINKVMIENFGAEWNDRPEFYKLNGSIQENAVRIKRNVPSFANIDVNLYTATLETLLNVVNADIYSDNMPNTTEIQKIIKERIFKTTQLDKMQGTMFFLRELYEKKYNVWEKYFAPLIEENEKWQKLQNDFVENRNHVAHNKLLDYRAKEKMLGDTKELRMLIEKAVIKFNSEIVSEEIEETLQVIEEQKEYERESKIEVIESEAGVRIRNRKEILQLFQDTLEEIYEYVLNLIYFDERVEVDEIKSLENISGDQIIFTIICGKEKLGLYVQVEIDDSEGHVSIATIDIFEEDDKTAEENISYVNGEAEFHPEQSCYMPVMEDSLNIDGVEVIKATIESFLISQREQEEGEPFF